MTEADPQKKEDAIAFLKSHRVGVLSTLADDGRPHARTIYFASDTDFNIYFLTFSNTRKAEDVSKHPQAAFTVSAEEKPQTLQVEGTIADITNTSVDDLVVTELFHNLNSNSKYFAPLTHFDRSDIRFFKLTPNWIRWGDFTKGTKTDEVLFEIPSAN